MQSMTNASRLRLWSIALMVALLAALSPALARPVQAAEPVTPAHSDPVWQASYWNNTALSGPPALERVEQAIDHDWGDGSPAPNINRDGFSARWTRYVDIPPGIYRLTAASDDGIRVYVDDRLVIDRWTVRSITVDTADVHLGGGHHLIRVEYFDQAGVAAVRFSISPAAEGGGRWRGEYYNNRSLSGSPAFVRNDERIDFDWGEDSPAPGRIGRDDFSIRWTGVINGTAGRYRFEVKADDGVRLWVNNHLLIDRWRDQPETTYQGEIYLPAGDVPVTLEYYEHAGQAAVRLSWTRIDGAETGAWRGEYFDNRHLSGGPRLVRNDSDIDFDWGGGSPAPEAIGRDDFSIRWTRALNFREGRYRFTITVDDGARLYIDDRLVIDEWRDGPRRRFTHTQRLSRGVHTIRLEYYEHTADAVVRLSWKRTGEQEEEREERPRVGNIITCAPAQPGHCAWVKIYRMEPDGSWIDVAERGFATCDAAGFLKIDGLPVDENLYGGAGHPYRVELWTDSGLLHSTGNVAGGEPEFRVRAFADNQTPWSCTP